MWAWTSAGLSYWRHHVFWQTRRRKLKMIISFSVTNCICIMISWWASFISKWTLCLVSAGSHPDKKQTHDTHHAGPSLMSEPIKASVCDSNGNEEVDYQSWLRLEHSRQRPEDALKEHLCVAACVFCCGCFFQVSLGCGQNSKHLTLINCRIPPYLYYELKNVISSITWQIKPVSVCEAEEIQFVS